MERLGEVPQSESEATAPTGLPFVSVVVSLYGSFSVARAVIALESIRAQAGVALDVVVAERGPESQLAHWLPTGVRHVFTVHDPMSDGPAYSPGRVRNDGVLACRGDYVYLTDADIVFQSATFLADCIALLSRHPDVVLRRPRMRRLPDEYFGQFSLLVEADGLASALGALHRDQDYIATLDRREHRIRVFSKVSDTDDYTKTFTASEDTLATVSPDRYGEIWPQVWSEDRHCGGILCRRSQLQRVAGYCEEFLSWGCEDSDLQWKLGDLFRMRFFPYTRTFEVLHLDHSKEYFSKNAWDSNEAICRIRRERGVLPSIAADRAQLAKRTDGDGVPWLLR